MDNCISTSVVARQSPQNTVNTVMFALKGRKHRTYRGFWLARRQKHWYLQCCLMLFAPMVSKKRKNTTKHILFDDFWLLKNEKKKLCSQMVARWQPSRRHCNNHHRGIAGVRSPSRSPWEITLEGVSRYVQMLNPKLDCLCQRLPDGKNHASLSHQKCHSPIRTSLGLFLLHLKRFFSIRFECSKAQCHWKLNWSDPGAALPQESQRLFGHSFGPRTRLVSWISSALISGSA